MKKGNKKMNKKGFTLIELLAVVVILGILMLVAIPAVQKYITNSRKKTFVSTVEEMVKTAKNAEADAENMLDNCDTSGTHIVYINSKDSTLLDKKTSSPMNGKEIKVYITFNGDGKVTAVGATDTENKAKMNDNGSIVIDSSATIPSGSSFCTGK